MGRLDISVGTRKQQTATCAMATGWLDRSRSSDMQKNATFATEARAGAEDAIATPRDSLSGKAMSYIPENAKAEPLA